MKAGREGAAYEALAGVLPADEPVFVLRAQDRSAAGAVRHWAMLNEQNGGDPSLTAMARAQAMKMDRWPKKKAADLEAKEPEASWAPPVSEGDLVGAVEETSQEQPPVEDAGANKRKRGRG